MGLIARLEYRVDPAGDGGQDFQVHTTNYRYHILDRDGREILAYHWHPDGVSSVTEPHLHLSGQLRPLDAGRRAVPIPLGEMHLPTGIVSLAQVVRLLITEFGVEPRRDDWETVLSSTA